MRCLALAQALRHKGHYVTLITKTTDSKLLARYEQLSIPIESIPTTSTLEGDARTVFEKARLGNFDWIVADGYNFNTEYQTTLRSSSSALLCIDDINAYPFNCDIVLNQNFNAEKVCKYHTGERTELLLGSLYALLRDEYQSLDGHSREVEGVGHRILVTLGGSDPHNCTRMVLQALQLIDNVQLDIRIILGRSFPHHESIIEITKELPHSARVFEWVESLREHIEWCDIAVSAAGSTTWELAALQTPMILGMFAENQRIICEQLQAREAAVVIGDFQRLDTKILANEVQQLLLNPDRRKSLSSTAGTLCDGQGAVRVVAAMESRR